MYPPSLGLFALACVAAVNLTEALSIPNNTDYASFVNFAGDLKRRQEEQTVDLLWIKKLAGIGDSYAVSIEIPSNIVLCRWIWPSCLNDLHFGISDNPQLTHDHLTGWNRSRRAH